MTFSASPVAIDQDNFGCCSRDQQCVCGCRTYEASANDCNPRNPASCLLWVGRTLSSIEIRNLHFNLLSTSISSAPIGYQALQHKSWLSQPLSGASSLSAVRLGRSSVAICCAI